MPAAAPVRPGLGEVEVSSSISKLASGTVFGNCNGSQWQDEGNVTGEGYGRGGKTAWSTGNADTLAAFAEPEVAVQRSMVSPERKEAPSYVGTAQLGGGRTGVSSAASGGGLGVFASMMVVSKPAPLLSSRGPCALSQMLRQKAVNSTPDAGVPGGENAQAGAGIIIYNI